MSSTADEATQHRNRPFHELPPLQTDSALVSQHTTSLSNNTTAYTTVPHGLYTKRERPPPLPSGANQHSRSESDLRSPHLTSPRSPRLPTPGLPTARSGRNRSGTATLPSPGRPRAGTVSGREGADKAFDELKEAASRDALREQHLVKSRSKEQLLRKKSGLTSPSVVDSVTTPAPVQPASPSLPSPRLPTMSSTSRAIRHGPHSTAIHRTTSLDSNVSSISSNTSNSFKPSVSHSHSASSASQDNAARQDIPSLIAAAGSAEAAIQKLLQEKASASAHTAQLWRLVEKQRAMIHGLNKDLERSLKDKERYRKKLKEHLVTSASTQSLPATAQKIGAERENSQSPALSELTPQEEIADAPVRTDSAQLARKDSEITLDSPTLERTAELPAPAQKLPGPSPLSTPQYLEILPTPPSGDDDRKPAVHSSSYIPANGAARYPAPVEIRIPTGTPPIPSQTPPPPHTPRLPSAPHSPKTPSQGHVKVGSLTGTTQMHSPQGFSSPKDRFGQPSRKAPPAPLVLSPKKAEQQDSVAVSDSEYEGSSADFPRGRRRTREEDDEEREALAIREAEHRSKSKQDKKSKSKSKSKPPQGHLAAVELPATKNDYEPVDSGAYLSDASSPEEPGSPGSPHVAQMQTYQSIGALASMVRTPTEVTVPQATKRTLVAPALMSPGLPISPRPGDRPMNAPVPRAPKTALSSIPMSPRAGGLPLSPRAPRQPIPLPPQTPLSVASPHLARAEAYHQQAQNASIAHRLNADVSMAAETGRAPAAGQPRSPGDIFRGFISEQYPDLLLPPNALPSIYVKVDSSRLRPARHSFMAAKQTDENPVFTLAVYARSDHSQLWRVEKTLFALSALDQQLKAASEFRTRLPDRGLFTGHAPARIDARRSALGLYFEKMLDTPMDEKAATIVCVFLTVDAIGAEIPEYFPNGATPSRPVDQPLPTARLRKDGYLTKRGKNFGGWKARYFLLDGPILKYYEAPGGAQLGSIKLQNAQIGKQQQQQLLQYEEDVDNQYRHAFLILEPKRKDSSSHVRHVLCAESDGERDAWVDSLLQYVDRKPEEEAATRTLQPLRDASSIAKSPRLQKSMNDLHRPGSRGTDSTQSRLNSLRSVPYNDTVAAEAPVIGPSGARLTSTPSPPITGSVSSSEVDEQHASSHPNISAPSNAHPIQNAESWGNKPASVVAPTPSGGKDKKRSIFGFRGRSSSDLQTGHQSKDSISQTSMHGSSMRGVFGVPLSEAVDVSAPTDVPVHLPAVVYRCIEYLQAKDAALEEGIFRLSGSNIVIKALRERFNNEGDVRLLDDGQYYDVHAVASLLKLYLRELPISILTREHHLDFVGCLDLPDDRSKVEAFNVLVNRLPRANRELLEALSAFLREIVDNEKINKMTVRNVGIVFAPTLNIPGPLISLFISDFGTIFGPPLDIDVSASPVLQQESHNAAFAPSDSIRSPRKQMFTDLPTPAYHQTTFNPAQPYGPYQAQVMAARNAYDTGFIPMQQTYEQSARPSAAPAQHQGGYGSLNDALAAPTNGHNASGPALSRAEKQARRESAFLVAPTAGLTQARKGSLQQLRENANGF